MEGVIHFVYVMSYNSLWNVALDLMSLSGILTLLLDESPVIYYRDRKSINKLYV